MLKDLLTKNRYLGIHFLFWLLYYVFFGIIWAKDGDYKASFFLEFILLPIRIFSVYFTVLYLLPQFLLKKKFKQFFGMYIMLLVVCSLLQRVFMHFFIDNHNAFNLVEIFEPSAVLRAMVLINTTVLLVLSIYILKHYFDERQKNELLDTGAKTLELKSNKRIYHIKENTITHVEGLGNYVTYHLDDNSSIVVYGVLKDALTMLSDNFIRVHKSHIVNKYHIKSYSKDNIELIQGALIPIGSSVNLDLTSLVIK